MATATSCWLFIGAQHVAATAPTIHYTSPRLMEEAPKWAEQNINNFNIEMTALLRARRSDAVAVTADLLESEARNRQLEKELSEAKELKELLQKNTDDLQARYDRLLAEIA